MNGHTVLITGAAAGIGRAAALEAARRGGSVLLVDRDLDKAAGVAREISAGGGAATAYACDVSRPADIEVLFTGLAEAGIVPDRLVAAAGVDLGGPTHELSRERWQDVLDINLTGTFLVSQAVVAGLLAHDRHGALVLCSSPAAYVGFSAGGAAAYSASKGGVSALVRSLAVDYARHGIRVNAVVPGATETELMWVGVPPAERDVMRAVIRREVPLGRVADPSEPARAAVWLLSDDASYVTGSHLVCDGGVLAKASISI